MGKNLLSTTEKSETSPYYKYQYNVKSDCKLKDSEYVISIGDQPVLSISEDTIEELKPQTEMDKVQVLKNIRYLIERYDLKIGMIEEESNNTKGYLSRLENPNSKATPNLNFLMKISEKCNVSIDMLLFGKLDGLTQSEEYLIDFVTKLKNDTANERLEWHRIQNLRKEEIEAMDETSFSKLTARELALNNISALRTQDDKEIAVVACAFRAYLPSSEDAVYVTFTHIFTVKTSEKQNIYFDVFLEDKNGKIIDLCDYTNLNKSVKLAIEVLYVEVLN